MEMGDPKQNAAPLEIVFHLRQDNRSERIIIEQIQDSSDALKELLNYKAQEMTEMNFLQYLPTDLSENIMELMDFDAEGNADFDEVMRRMPHFAMTPSQGRRKRLEHKIERDVSTDEHPRFILRITPPKNPFADEYDRLGSLKLEESEQLHIPVPERSVFVEGMEIACDIVAKDSSVPCTVGVIAIDRFQTLPIEDTKRVMQAVLSSAKGNIRDTDMIGHLGAGKIGVLMPETGYETADVPLKRIRIDLRVLPEVREHGLSFVGVYAEIRDGIDPDDLLEECEVSLKDNSRFPHVSMLETGI